MIRIPNDRQWTQTNRSDVFGSLHSTYNVHFDEQGYLKLAPKSASIYSTDNNADFGLPLAIFPLNSGYFILTADQPFILTSNLTITELTEDTPPSDFGVNSDATVWQAKAYCTTSDDLVSYEPVGVNWATGLKTLTSGVPHPVEVMGNFSNGHLAVGNGNTVLRLSTDHSTVVTLTINNNYQVTSLKYYNNNLYIATKAEDGGEAKIFVWNGSGTAAQAEYKTGANWVFALEEYQSSIVGITSEGQLVRFTGGGFQAIASLPVYYSNYRWTSSTDRVQRRGLRVDGDKLYINLQGMVSNVDDFYYLYNQPSGIWCYEPGVGLHCRHLSTDDKLSSVSVSSRSGDTLTLASATLATTGEPVYVTNVGSLTGISANTTYYLVKVSGTEIQLATSPESALAGDVLTLTGTAGAASVKLIEYQNFGLKYEMGNPGAIGIISFDGTSPKLIPEITRTKLVWGFSADSTTNHLNSLTVGKNIGGFTTTKIWSEQITDTFNKVHVKYADLLEGEQIIVKSRNRDVLGLPSPIMEGAFSTDRIAGSDSDYMTFVADGHNVNLLSGNGASRSVSVTTLDDKEFEFDEALDSVSSGDPSTFTVDNFKKATVITDHVANHGSAPIDENSSWAQVMVELRGRNVKVEELQLVQTANKPSV